MQSRRTFDLYTITLAMTNGSVQPSTVRYQIEEAGCADARGVYAILLAGPAGEIPWWVGRAVMQNFWQECGSDHVMAQVRDALLQGEGQPVLWLIPHSMSARQKIDKQAIKTMETDMIEMAYERNPYLLNKYQLPKPLDPVDIGLGSQRLLPR